MQILNFSKQGMLTKVIASFVLMLSMQATAIVGGHEYQFDSEDELENQTRAALFQQLAEELRCPKCQNQNLADSNAMIAGDLRRELYSQVKDGKNAEQIVDFMVNRYGEFVLYRPALNNRTLVLWYGPIILLVLALLIFLSIVLKRKSNNKDAQSVSEDELPDTVSADEQKRIDELLNASAEETKSDQQDKQEGN